MPKRVVRSGNRYGARSVTIMDEYIYWEKQDSGELCAVHAINNLLQGPYFDAVALAQIAHDLDAQERELALAADESQNVAESGYYSIQVIAKALENHVLDTEYYANLVSKGGDPSAENAFICNREYHWYTIRKINGKWYDLNSLNDEPGPLLISEFYLEAKLSTIQHSGYTIFVIRGDLPRLYVAEGLNYYQYYVPITLLEQVHAKPARDNDEDLQKAIQMSLGYGEEDDELQQAIQMSIAVAQEEAKQEELEEDGDEEDELEKAIAMSMQVAQEATPGLQVSVQLPTGEVKTKAFAQSSRVVDVFQWVEAEVGASAVKLVDDHTQKPLAKTTSLLEEAQSNLSLVCHIENPDTA